MANKKLTKKQIESMKNMFMEYKSVTEIARVFGVARNTVAHHCNTEAWVEQRKLNENELLSTFDDGKKADFVKMTQSAVAIMQRSLENLATRAEAPSINEATRASDILKTLDNILRLDDGKPTDIVKNTDKPLSERELKEKLSADPFSTIGKEAEDDEKLN